MIADIGVIDNISDEVTKEAENFSAATKFLLITCEKHLLMIGFFGPQF